KKPPLYSQRLPFLGPPWFRWRCIQFLLGEVLDPLGEPLHRHAQHRGEPHEDRQAGEAPIALPIAEGTAGDARPPGQLRSGQAGALAYGPQVLAEAHEFPSGKDCSAGAYGTRTTRKPSSTQPMPTWKLPR